MQFPSGLLSGYQINTIELISTEPIGFEKTLRIAFDPVPHFWRCLHQTVQVHDSLPELLS